MRSPIQRVQQLADRLADELAQRGTKARAVAEKAYLKSELVHLGVPVPEIRKQVVATLKDITDLTHDELIAAVEALWHPGIHELRMAAIELLVKRVKLLGTTDLPLVERLIRSSKTWAYVDVLATHVMGALVTRNAGLGKTLDRWATDDDFWIRRSALLALLVPLRKGGGDFERFSRYADAMLDEKEFFIRKAIGWILREVGRERPAIVFDWILPRAERASGVTIREAVKPLTAAQRAQVMQRYQAR